MTARIVGRFLDHTGTPLQGEVELVPLVRTVTRAGMDAVYLPARQVVPLDVAGRLDLEVVAPGEGMNPSGWVWAARPHLSSGGRGVTLAPFLWR